MSTFKFQNGRWQEYNRILTGRYRDAENWSMAGKGFLRSNGNWEQIWGEVNILRFSPLTFSLSDTDVVPEWGRSNDAPGTNLTYKQISERGGSGIYSYNLTQSYFYQYRSNPEKILGMFSVNNITDSYGMYYTSWTKSLDGGRTWNYPTTQVFDANYLADMPSVFSSKRYPGWLHLSVDGGVTWKPATASALYDPNLGSYNRSYDCRVVMHPEDDSRGFFFQAGTGRQSIMPFTVTDTDIIIDEDNIITKTETVTSSPVLMMTKTHLLWKAYNTWRRYDLATMTEEVVDPATQLYSSSPATLTQAIPTDPRFVYKGQPIVQTGASASRAIYAPVNDDFSDVDRTAFFGLATKKFPPFRMWDGMWIFTERDETNGLGSSWTEPEGVHILSEDTGKVEVTLGLSSYTQVGDTSGQTTYAIVCPLYETETSILFGETDSDSAHVHWYALEKGEPQGTPYLDRKKYPDLPTYSFSYQTLPTLSSAGASGFLKEQPPESENFLFVTQYPVGACLTNNATTENHFYSRTNGKLWSRARSSSSNTIANVYSTLGRINTETFAVNTNFASSGKFTPRSSKLGDWLYYSEDYGETFTPVGGDTTSSLLTEIRGYDVDDVTGDMYVLYTNSTGSSEEQRIARVDATTLEVSHFLDTGITAGGQYAAIHVAGNGKIFIGYRHGSNDHRVVWTTDNGDTWKTHNVDTNGGTLSGFYCPSLMEYIEETNTLIVAGFTKAFHLDLGTETVTHTMSEVTNNACIHPLNGGYLYKSASERSFYYPKKEETKRMAFRGAGAYGVGTRDGKIYGCFFQSGTEVIDGSSTSHPDILFEGNPFPDQANLTEKYYPFHADYSYLEYLNLELGIFLYTFDAGGTYRAGVTAFGNEYYLSATLDRTKLRAITSFRETVVGETQAVIDATTPGAWNDLVPWTAASGGQVSVKERTFASTTEFNTTYTFTAESFIYTNELLIPTSWTVLDVTLMADIAPLADTIIPAGAGELVLVSVVSTTGTSVSVGNSSNLQPVYGYRYRTGPLFRVENPSELAKLSYTNSTEASLVVYRINKG